MALEAIFPMTICIPVVDTDANSLSASLGYRYNGVLPQGYLWYLRSVKLLTSTNVAASASALNTSYLCDADGNTIASLAGSTALTAAGVAMTISATYRTQNASTSPKTVYAGFISSGGADLTYGVMVYCEWEARRPPTTS